MSKESTNETGQPIGFAVPGWKPAPHPGRVVLAGRYCDLEPLNPDVHAVPLWEANSRNETGAMWTYLPYGPFESFENYRGWMEKTCMGADPMFYAIIDKTIGSPVGVAAYLRIDMANGAIEVGHIAFSPLLQRTPVATEAMYLMMKRVFELGYRRYEWKCNALNAPSRAAAVRLGFVPEGTFRQVQVVKGRNRDTAWFSVIDSEWPGLERAFIQWLDPGNFDADGKQRKRLADFRAG